MPHAAPRHRILPLGLAAGVSEAFLAVAVRGSLGPLPDPACSLPDAVDGLDGLWRALPRPPAARRESAFQSTMRVVKRDVRRKLEDQVPGLAGRGETPPGFERVQGVATEAGRAPIHGIARPPRGDRPGVVLVHGLYDSQHSRYVMLMGDWLARQGFGVLQVDMRWHGHLLSERWLPSLGLEESMDLVSWARWLKDRWDGRPVAAVGFSLGALSVIHALARPEAPEVFDAGGIVVSPPGSLTGALRNLDAPPSLRRQGLDAFVQYGFQRLLGDRMALLDLDRRSPGGFRRLLEWLAPRLPGGGLSAEELLARTEPGPALARCRTPLLVVWGEDDPVFRDARPGRSGEEAAPAPTVRLLPTPGGGHLGHLGTYPDWIAELFHRYLTLVPRVAPGDP